MKEFSLTLLLSLFGCSFILTTSVCAQSDYLFLTDFDNCVSDDMSPLGLTVSTQGSPSCVCSPSGDAFAFNDASDAFVIQDSNLRFQQAFSISIVFRPDSDLDDQRIITYTQDCISDQGFKISYHGSRHTLGFELSEALGRSVFFELDLDRNRCWHAATFVKAGASYIAYLYGEEVFQTQASATYDVGQNAVLMIGTGPCVPVLANSFQGALDYISIFDEILPILDIQALNYQTDHIITPNALIFLNDQITPEVDAPCATSFLWSPSTGVSDINAMMPELSPNETTTYTLQITDGGCQVFDSLRVLVVDPNEVTCEKLILPTAFTPNGDQLNDTYFISNGFVVDRLIRFEIFDRWGGKLFTTSDVTMGWDGQHQGKYVHPGVYVFKAEFECNGEVKTQVGSFSVLN